MSKRQRIIGQVNRNFPLQLVQPVLSPLTGLDAAEEVVLKTIRAELHAT